MKRLVAPLIVVLTLAATSQAQTIVDIAASNDDFTMLASLMEAARQIQAFSAPGPFTLFAPTNAAFDALPEGLIEALRSDPDALADLLDYHVIAGQLLASDVTALDGESAVTLEGEALSVHVVDQDIAVGDAHLVLTDIIASNGVVHAIDKVLIPSSVAGALQPSATGTGVPDSGGSSYTSAAVRSARFGIDAVGGSGVNGSVLVADYGPSRTVIVIGLTGTPPGALLTASLLTGDCGGGGATLVPLEAVEGGSGLGVTTTTTPFDEIVNGNHYLAIQHATSGRATTVACGEVGTGGD